MGHVVQFRVLNAIWNCLIYTLQSVCSSMYLFKDYNQHDLRGTYLQKLSLRLVKQTKGCLVLYD